MAEKTGTDENRQADSAQREVLHGDGGDRISLTELFRDENLDALLRRLAEATGIAVAIANYRGDEYTDCINYAGFCRFARGGSDQLCKVANATNAFGTAQAAVTKEPYFYFCPFGLLMVAIPIIINGEYLGGFIGGQVRCEDAPPDTPHLQNVLPYKKDFLEDEEARLHYESTTKISFRQYTAYASMIEAMLREITTRRGGALLRNRMEELRRELEHEKALRTEAERRAAQFRAGHARSIIRPYYILRMLNAISNLAIVEHAERTNEQLVEFTRLLTALIRRERELSTLEEAFALTDAWCRTCGTFLGDQLQYSLRLPEEMRRQSIPALLVFQITEHIVYRLSVQRQGTCSVTVTAAYEGDETVLRITAHAPQTGANEQRELLVEKMNEREDSAFRDTGALLRESLGTYFEEAYSYTEETGEDGETVCTLRYPRLYEKVYL